MPRANFASSVIISGPNGGSNVVSIKHSSTPSTDITAECISATIWSAAGQNADVSVCVILAFGSCSKSIVYINPRSYILTDISRDGMLKGLNIDLINENLNLSKKNLIVGGGLSTYKDLEALNKIKSKKLEGVILGKSFYVGNIEIKKGMGVLNKDA